MMLSLSLYREKLIEEPPTHQKMASRNRSDQNPKMGAVDFISKMPDAILVSILSRLSSTEEAIRTSILSTRWRYLWTEIPSLDLNIRYRSRYKKDEFKEFVDWVLKNRSVDLDSFTLCCLEFYTMSTVEQWIHMAVARNVKQLDLTFYPNDRTQVMVLPHCLVTCPSLEVLKLNTLSHCVRLPDNSITGFGALRALHLDCVDLYLMDKGDLVKDFLERCPVLEELTLLDCELLHNIDLFSISSLKLKKLSVVNIYNDVYVMCGGIKICCPKLVDLELRGHVANNFFLESQDSLKKAKIQLKLERNNISVLFPGISGVEYLWIDSCFFIECINATSDPALPNLKTLVLTTTMDAFTMEKFNRILKYYPKLESLKVMIKQEFFGRQFAWLDEAEKRRILTPAVKMAEFFEFSEEAYTYHTYRYLEGTEYKWLDEDETTRILTPDVKTVEFFEFNGKKPKVVIKWFEVILEMFFTWGDEARLSRW